jgi:hypothetical protein
LIPFGLDRDEILRRKLPKRVGQLISCLVEALRDVGDREPMRLLCIRFHVHERHVQDIIKNVSDRSREVMIPSLGGC